MTMEMRPVVAIPARLSNAIAAAYAAGMEKEIGPALSAAAAKIEKALARAQGGEGYAAQKIVQHRGPTLRFDGKLLDEYTTRRGGQDRWQTGEVWETRGGAYVAVLAGCSVVAGEVDLVTATVIEPGGDEQERRLAVAAALNYSEMAVSMLRGMGWTLERDVA